MPLHPPEAMLETVLSMRLPALNIASASGSLSAQRKSGKNDIFCLFQSIEEQMAASKEPKEPDVAATSAACSSQSQACSVPKRTKPVEDMMKRMKRKSPDEYREICMLEEEYKDYFDLVCDMKIADDDECDCETGHGFQDTIYEKFISDIARHRRFKSSVEMQLLAEALEILVVDCRKARWFG